jgi:hypothetical protein
MSVRNHSTPFASIFAHRSGVSRIERRTRVSSGALGGLPRPRFGCSSCVMERTVAPIIGCTTNPCIPDFSCYIKFMNKTPSLSEKQIQAIRLIDCGTRSRLTPLGNTLVSNQAKSLKSVGLICEAPERWIAYRLTAAGKDVLADGLVRAGDAL